MLNDREKKSMFIISMISIVFAMVIAVPWGVKDVLTAEIVVKVWVLPLLGLVLYLLNLNSKYRNYRPSVRYTTVTSYFPLFTIAFASLANALLMLVRSTRPFASNMSWLWMVIFVAGLFVAVGLLTHFFYKAVIVFSKNESMLIDALLAVLYLGVLFLTSSIANRYHGLEVAFENTSVLLIITPIVLGLLIAAVQVLSLVRLYISNPEYSVESKKALIEEFMALHKREYDYAENHLLKSLYTYSKEQLGIEDIKPETLAQLEEEKASLEAKLAELEEKLSEETESEEEQLNREQLLDLQERLAQLQVVLGEVQVQCLSQENALKEQKNEVEEEVAHLEEERKALEEEKSSLEEERKALEEEKSSLEEARKALEEEKSSLEEERKALEEEKSSLEEEQASFQKEKDEYVPQVVEVPVPQVVVAPKPEPKPKPAKVFVPSFEELIGFVKAQGNDINVVSNAKNTQHKFMIGKKPFLIMQKTNSDYRLVFLAKRNYAMSLINKLPGAVSKPTSPKGENWFKIVNKGELDANLVQQAIAKSYEFLANPEPKPEPKVLKPTFNKLVKYAGSLPDKEIRQVANAKGNLVKFYLGKKLFLVAQSTSSDYRITFCSTPEQAYNLIVKYPGTVVKATSPKGEEWFKFTNKGEFDEKEIKAMIKLAAKYIEDQVAEELRIKEEQKAEARRLKEEERARQKAEREAIKLAEKEAARARKEAEKAEQSENGEEKAA